MHTARLAALRTRLDDLGLNGLVVTHPPNVRYLVGLHASAAALVISPSRAIIVVDSRYLTVAERAASVLPETFVRKATRGLDEAVGDILRTEPPGRIGIEAAYLSVARFNKLTRVVQGSDEKDVVQGVGPHKKDVVQGFSSADVVQSVSPDDVVQGLGPVAEGSPETMHHGGELVPTERIVERARAVKDAVEMEILRTAGRMLAAVARELPAFVLRGRTERQVAAMIEHALRDGGFDGPAFETIVASGPNSALPHARPTTRTIGEGEGVVLDFGGIYDGYCVDLTRTLHVGPPTEAFRRLFDAVAEAHAAALAAVKPGALPVDIDGAARRVLEQRGLGDAFGHGTGHGLGLEVHEEPRISPLAAADEPVLAGMVFTIEPGVYVPGVGGVRIEDDVLVVEGGCEILT